VYKQVYVSIKHYSYSKMITQMKHVYNAL